MAAHENADLTPAPVPEAREEPPPLTARMLNEFVYCPRLFYYEFVEGVFAHNADTLRGAHLHKRVDAGSGKLPPARKNSAAQPSGAPSQSSAGGVTASNPDEAAQRELELAAKRERGEVIHSRSVWLSSARHEVSAKLDLVETRDPALSGGQRRAVPVDYKKGAPREGEDHNELWDADRIQLGLQMLILRENGYDCAEGVIYYQQTKQRVRLPWTADLETWIDRTIAQARACSASPVIPPPLRQSPKCPRCSLVTVCLPDETLLLSASQATAPASEAAATDASESETGAANTPEPSEDGSKAVIGRLPIDSNAPPPRTPTPSGPVRLLMAARDDRRALYLNTPGLWVGIKSERLVVKDGDKEVQTVRLGDVNHLALLGNIQLSTQALQTLCELEIPVTYFSMGGWFYGIAHGHGLKNVFTRIAQFRAAADPAVSLAFAKLFVHGKIRNQRTFLMRNHIEAPDRALLRLRQAAQDVFRARSAGELLGMEGAAAAVYFEHFAGMIKAGRRGTDAAANPGADAAAGERAEHDEGEIAGDCAEDAGCATTAAPENAAFDFRGRNRRPPRDPVNALLSLAYALLSKDCMLAALNVGFDPYVGFYHQPRHGRPALALDLMEEFRPLIAESAVITALNNRILEPGDFLRAGEAVNLTKAGRRRFFDCYEQRMNSLIRHPVFDYQVSYRRALELQARLLARALTGEIADYRPLMTR